ncbi:DUF2196 domain-containing protein [Halosolutus halophilus]|uniref:DUF2196 domain-containing protein n=1 Tax=Halosolutus halophilus TaxID=1552990 RepID=UPI0022351811|nr:DUF2196 domain-containing protein [Halosolutus halophilus]
MSEERPTADDLRQGLTVEIVRGDQDVQSTETEPIVGEIGTIYGDEPEGPEVEPKSGVVGHVRSVVHDESTTRD